MSINISFKFLKNMSYKLETRKSIYSLVGRLPKREIVDIFQNENISKTTIYRTIAECEQGIPCLNLPKSGRPKVLSEVRENRVVESARHKVGTSHRKLARRFHVSNSTIQRTLERRNLTYRKRRKCPKYTQNQLQRIPICCRALRRIHFANNKRIILDDEKYFTFSNSEMKGNDGFYTDNIEDCPNEVATKAKKKFEDKVLVWAAISDRGISRPYVGRVRGEAVDANIYTQRCLPKLVDFINEQHIGDEIMFWPDLASCHYARITRDWLAAHNIPFVPKEDNPPNIPQARPIETFWSLLSRKVYDNGWEAADEQMLRRRIYQKIREVDVASVQDLMRQVRTKLRQIEDNGPLAVR